MRKSLPLAVLLATAALVPAACSKTPAVPTATFDGGVAFGLQEGGAPGVPAPSGSPMALGTVVPSGSTSASAAPSGSASAAPSASASASAAVAAGVDAALDAAIVALAAKDAPGMTSEGTAGHETLQPGGHYNMIVTMQPGRCYTIIAMSAPLQVSELDVRLYMLPLNVEAGHSPPTDKNPAVLGKGNNKTCPISPIAVPYKIDVAARKGAGRVAVGVFSKSK
jgi:hypothetical protein